jgi:hypothetical protein
MKTNIPGVWASSNAPGCYRVVRSRFANGIAIVPFVYLATDDREEALREAQQHPETSVLDIEKGQTVSEVVGDVDPPESLSPL